MHRKRAACGGFAALSYTLRDIRALEAKVVIQMACGASAVLATHVLGRIPRSSQRLCAELRNLSRLPARESGCQDWHEPKSILRAKNRSQKLLVSPYQACLGYGSNASQTGENTEHAPEEEKATAGLPGTSTCGCGSQSRSIVSKHVCDASVTPFSPCMLPSARGLCSLG